MGGKCKKKQKIFKKKVKLPLKFEIYTDKKGEFRFRLLAANGEIIAKGESYPDKAACKKEIATIKKNALEAPVLDTTTEATTLKKVIAKVKTTAKKKAAPKAGAKPRGRKPKAV